MQAVSFVLSLSFVAVLCLGSLSARAQVTGSEPGHPPLGIAGDDRGAAHGAQPADHPVPVRILYDFLFAHLVALQQTAAKLDAEGKDGSPYLTIYSRAAGLTDDEGAILNEVAHDWRRQQDAIESRIKALTAARRSEPNPPKNLLTMDEFSQFNNDQDENMQSHIQELKSRLGDTSFAQLDAYVKVRFHPTVAQPPGDVELDQPDASPNNGGSK